MKLITMQKKRYFLVMACCAVLTYRVCGSEYNREKYDTYRNFGITGIGVFMSGAVLDVIGHGILVSNFSGKDLPRKSFRLMAPGLILTSSGAGLSTIGESRYRIVLLNEGAKKIPFMAKKCYSRAAILRTLGTISIGAHYAFKDKNKNIGIALAFMGVGLNITSLIQNAKAAFSPFVYNLSK